MKFLLLMNYEGGAGCDVPLPEWPQEDIARHIAFQGATGEMLTERGELVSAEGLAGPDAVRTVTSDGRSAPVVTDGPYAEVKEVLAGYWMVDVDSAERAVEIAAHISAAPGLGGVPIQQPIQVRQVMGAESVQG